MAIAGPLNSTARLKYGASQILRQQDPRSCIPIRQSSLWTSYLETKKNRWLEQTKEPHLGIQALNGVNSGIN